MVTDPIIENMAQYGYTCTNSLTLDGFETSPIPAYNDNKLRYITTTDESGVTYTTSNGNTLHVDGFEPPIFLTDGTMYTVESDGTMMTLVGADKQIIGSYDNIEYTDTVYPKLFLGVQKEDMSYQMVGDTVYGPYLTIKKRWMDPVTGLFYLYAQKEDQKWYYIDADSETEVSSKGYFLLTNDGTDVMQMYYPDDSHPEKYIILKWEKITDVPKSEEFTYQDGRYGYRTDNEQGAFAVVGDEKYGPFDEVARVYFAPKGLGYMYIFYQGGEKYLMVNGERFGPYEDLDGLNEFTYVDNSYFTYSLRDWEDQKYEKNYHDKSVPSSGPLKSTPGWYGQFSADGNDWIFYVKKDGLWYALINGNIYGDGYEDIVYHSFAPKSIGGNAVAVEAAGETGVVIWSDGSKTNRNNILDFYDNGDVQVLIYEYKGKQLVDVNGERLGVFDDIQEWYVDEGQVYIVTKSQEEGTTSIQTTTETYGPFWGVENLSIVGGSIFYTTNSTIHKDDVSYEVGAPVLHLNVLEDGNMGFAVSQKSEDDNTFAYREYACVQ